MAYKEPLKELILGSASYAEDLSFHALIDLSEIVSEKKIEDARVIGGHMVTFHVQRWGLGDALYRATLDADLGVPPIVARTERIVDALEGRGYERYTGNRYRREIPELRDQVEENFAVVDVLIPAYTSRPRENVRVDDKLTTIEVPGLASALLAEPVTVRVSLSPRTGGEHQIDLRLPDEMSGLVLKAFAWRQRSAGRDIVDVWRLLEVGAAAGVSVDAQMGDDGALASRLIRSAFSELGSEGTRALVAELKLNERAATERFARIQALIDRVLPT
ncbi:MAG: nucleotidyl transferase AbiEii/AbiGii toxin family protein [Actinomycetota bacterium]|nr:nucleotidyl transferase AbiEii/AbiGii toxin family protein [Actinomycetota bacterium]